MIYKCKECGSVFDEPQIIKTTHGGRYEAYGYEKYGKCPNCPSGVDYYLIGKIETDLINALVIICNELKQNEVEEILIRKSVDTGLDCDDFRSYIKRSLEVKNIRSVEVFEL